MLCCIGLLALSLPRLALFLVFMLSDYVGQAFDSNLWPFMGFFFLPTTTLAYAWAINSYGSLEGAGLIAVVLGVLLDIGVIGGSAKHRRGNGDD
ncbi:MAG: hypothetical protein ACI8X5_002068 [Planctomycetota bacterium]|jgi:hypothetical protein